jgi:hypothetical protein
LDRGLKEFDNAGLDGGNGKSFTLKAAIVLQDLDGVEIAQ